MALNRPADELPGSISLDAHGSFSWLVDRTFHKDNPADFVGDYTAGGTMFGVGGTLNMEF
jgi:long-chain fatty acid transport protein